MVVTGGVDQMMVQRCFCCKGPKQARWAIISSCIGQFLMIICLFVGLALWMFYKKSGLPGVPSPEETALIGENANNILPVFVKFRIPALVGGIIVAGVFAAAISSLEGILAALAEQTLASMKMAGFKAIDDAHAIRWSRAIICVWGVVLCAMASLFWYGWQGKGLIIELALSVVGLVAGGVLAVFLMALIPRLRRESLGMELSATLSVMTVFAFIRHPDFAAKTDRFMAVWPFWAIVLASAALLFFGLVFRSKKDPLAVPKMLPFIALVFFIHLFKFTNGSGELVNITVGWPWYGPIGLLVMLAASRVLCFPLARSSEE